MKTSKQKITALGLYFFYVTLKEYSINRSKFIGEPLHPRIVAINTLLELVDTMLNIKTAPYVSFQSKVWAVDIAITSPSVGNCQAFIIFYDQTASETARIHLWDNPFLLDILEKTAEEMFELALIIERKKDFP
jgi:hypothetical protein